MSEHDLAGEIWKSPLPSLLDISVARRAGQRGLDEDIVAKDSQDDSFQSISISPSLSQHGVGRPFEDREKARLFMHYIHDLSTWVDVSDKRRHFGTEVPKRACHSPLLAYAIIALASRSLCSIKGTDDSKPSTYYSHALQILIPILGSSTEALNEEVLAAIVILRQYEEMTDTDFGVHLSGSSKLLNSMFSLASKGGLGEAASWIVLRQDYWVALVKSQPLSINLDSYKGSSSFVVSDPECLANLVGYQHYSLARMILHIFNPYLSKPSLDTFRRRRESEQAVLDNFRLLLGLAISNPLVVNASFTAAHALRACGIYLTDPKEQRESLDLLDKLHQRTGWRTKDLEEQLNSQWSQDSCNSAFGHLFAEARK
ncbi:uncharacterized protein CLUP02_04330 [Colletotrichum lupini]|uniref:Uncharacterized protein n=1 Tax=Colletotrichum lupini TaxID=145971 RepID=A0A9Q8SK41_9PEZI|nr:uncharacterized protein CLUP02_04330 [Colletotrichum lupini]UQC78852.1 hypothetical protein CLUP02_04330 [Colletotrichum lupini]